jgi:acyl carrier protein
LFRQLSAVLSPSTRFEHLRYLGFGGDRVLPSDIEFVKRVCPPTCTARIGYGASEVKIISRYFFNAQSPAFSHPVPVGYAFEDTEVQILGESGEVLGYDQVGEIAVKSRYMSPGYWRRPDLTAQKFRRDPEDEAKRIYLTGDLGRLRPDGCLIHLGRKDFQVKIRGYRVEVEEIEAALLALPQIRHVAVTTHEEGDGERSLVAYLVADGSWQPRVSELRRSLQQKLPEYMLPKHYIFLDELPRAAFGKVDLRALPLPYATRPPLDAPYTAPRTPLETLVASIWQDVLGIEQIGIYDHFLELGGDSLQAMRISSKILQETQSEIPRNLLLQLSTVAEMALAVLKWYVSAVDLVPINEIGELLSALEMMPQVEANELPIEKLERRLYDNI